MTTQKIKITPITRPSRQEAMAAAIKIFDAFPHMNDHQRNQFIGGYFNQKRYAALTTKEEKINFLATEYIKNNSISTVVSDETPGDSNLPPGTIVHLHTFMEEDAETAAELLAEEDMRLLLNLSPDKQELFFGGGRTGYNLLREFSSLSRDDQMEFLKNRHLHLNDSSPKPQSLKDWLKEIWDIFTDAL